MNESAFEMNTKRLLFSDVSTGYGKYANNHNGYLNL